jgi:hypothetical protein
MMTADVQMLSVISQQTRNTAAARAHTSMISFGSRPYDNLEKEYSSRVFA